MGSRVTISNDPVKHDFMEVGRLEFQHLMNARPANAISCNTNFCGCVTQPPKGRVNQILAVTVEQIKRGLVCTRRNFDKLRKSIADLSYRKCPKESEVEKCVHRCMVRSEAIFVSAIVDRHLDRDGSINEANDGRRNADIVGVATVSSTGKSGGQASQQCSSLGRKHCELVIPGDISDQSSSDD